jgi:3',5'-cyclic-AMP phosphodiesterase
MDMNCDVRPRSLAHLSDLHFGLGREVPARAAELCRALLVADVDHVVVTGDVTEGGRRRSYAEFQRAFAPLLAAGRMTVIPGNHDRLGDDVGAQLMGGRRVAVVEVPGTYLVCVDSTGPHNRASVVSAHGRICAAVLAEVDAALARAPAGALVALLLHHHPLPLPEESFVERVATRLGLPYAAELTLGPALLRRARGRCDLVLHGHRHVPAARLLDAGGERPLRVHNAGSSTARGGMTIFRHMAGALLSEPRWLQVAAPAGAPGAHRDHAAPSYAQLSVDF